MNTDKKGLGFIRVHRCSSVADLSLRSQAQSDSSSRPKLWVDLRSPETHLGGTGREEQRTVPAGNVSGGRTQERQQECRRCRLKSAPRRSPVVSTRCPEVSGESRPSTLKPAPHRHIIVFRVQPRDFYGHAGRPTRPADTPCRPLSPARSQSRRVLRLRTSLPHYAGVRGRLQSALQSRWQTVRAIRVRELGLLRPRSEERRVG